MSKPDPVRKALERINEWCCYASEEDTSVQAMALQQIGVHARAALSAQPAADLAEELAAIGRSVPAEAWAAALSAQPPSGSVEMSPEFTDTARDALLWVLWHHQGGSSPVGQPIRFALGMGAHERLSDHHINMAKRWAALTKSTTAEFHQQPPSGWQPIETAPKDGTYILVSNGHGVWIAHWAPIAVSGYRFEQPWRSCMLNCDHIADATKRYLPPTHWMPLPAAPKPEGTK